MNTEIMLKHNVEHVLHLIHCLRQLSHLHLDCLVKPHKNGFDGLVLGIEVVNLLSVCICRVNLVQSLVGL